MADENKQTAKLFGYDRGTHIKGTKEVVNSMFELNVRFQIAAVMVLVFIILDFFRYPKVKVYSTKFFMGLIAVVASNLLFDIISVYSIYHIDKIAPWFQRLVNQCYLTSLIAVFLMSFMYVNILAKDQKRIEWKGKFIVLCPFLISFLFILFGELKYHTEEGNAYFYGSMVYAVIISVIVYQFAIIGISFRKSNSLQKQHRTAVRSAALVTLCLFGVQILIPRLTLSGLCFMLAILILYLAIENQKGYIENELGLFNKNAFVKMLSEYFEQKKALTVVNIVLENYEQVLFRFGSDVVVEAMEHIWRQSQVYCPMNKYHIKSNTITVLCQRTPEQCQRVFKKVAKLLKVDSFEKCQLQCHIDILNIREQQVTKDDVFELMDFMEKQRYGKNCSVHCLDADMVASKKRVDRIEMLLNKALEEDGFEMVYQPIYSTKKQTFASAEALIRMPEDEELGYISPEEFIPIAEEKGLIMEIGDTVLEKVAQFIERSHLLEKGVEYIEVNLSRMQIVAVDICNRVQEIVGKYQISPDNINLEITETATINDDLRMKENMLKLQAAGFRFSMDDFGTGYSNLAQMTNVNYDLIKLDKSLIWPGFHTSVLHPEKSKQEKKQVKSVLHHVVEMIKCREFGIVAEGIETKEMVDYFTAQGVEYLQGAYYSQPLKEKEFLHFIEGK